MKTSYKKATKSAIVCIHIILYPKNTQWKCFVVALLLLDDLGESLVKGDLGTSSEGGIKTLDLFPALG